MNNQSIPQPQYDADYKEDFVKRLIVERDGIILREQKAEVDGLLKDSIKVEDEYNAVLCADMLIMSTDSGFKTVMNDRGGDVIHRYDSGQGIWVNDGKPFIETQIEQIMGLDAKPSFYRDVLKHVQVKSYVKAEDFEEDNHIIVFPNGCFNVLTGELTEFSPHYNARSRLPMNYDPSADCPAIKRFMAEVLSPENVAFMQEWAGYHFLKDYRFQRCVVLVNDGDGGKSTLLSIFIAAIGRENVASQNLYRISTNRFAVAELYGKIANISADISPTELKNTGTLKMLTGWDMITAERKNRDPFQFRNYAKLTFSCNQLPRTPDQTLAFYKRVIPIQFERSIPLEEQDANLLEKLTTPLELSGFFNWAYEGLLRALERGCLKEPLDVQERKELYENMSDPVTGFIREYVVEDAELSVNRTDLYRWFTSYCKGKGIIPKTDRAFFKEIRANCYCRDTNKTIDKVQYRMFQGISCTYEQPRQEEEPGLGQSKLMEAV